MKLWAWFVTVLFTIGLFAMFITADPTDAGLTRGSSTRGVGENLGNQTAEDGNITILNINQDSITDTWQGFYGNVTGQIVLESATGNNFYDWNYANISGEIYAARRTISSWSTINCTNRTYWETEETSLGIELASVQGVNETYSSTTHPTFATASRTMTGCQATRPYNSTELSSTFWNVLLSVDSTTVVYTALLADSEDNYVNGRSDYEILVPVNRSTGTARYFFYAELH